MYNPETKKIIVSKDVKFDESKSWNWEEELGNKGLTWEEMMDESEEVRMENPNQEENDEEEEAGIEQNPQEAVAAENAEIGTQLRDGARRAKKALMWMKDYVCKGMRSIVEEDGDEAMAMFIAEEDPVSFDDAAQHDKWRSATEAEIKAIEENNTWELVELPDGAKVIGVKWIFKTKFNEKGEVDKFKAILVAKGYHQTYGVDFHEVFALVARWYTIRLILGLAAQEEWKVFQLDVKSAFFHGELNEDVYIEQPRGFEVGEASEKVYKLRKALYGLK